MTREEAIQELQNCKGLIQQDGQDYLDERDIPIIDMAIEALSADRPTHERDLISRHEALMEINGACEMWEDDAIVADIIHKLPSIEIVRCKDCIHWQKTNIETIDGHPIYDCPFCGEWADANGFCSFGERREP